MKKQFMRYKLIADQKVGRANKTEVLNDELLQVEKHLERVKFAYQLPYKKLQQCLHSHGHNGDIDKRLKRIPENHLGISFLESKPPMDNDNVLDESLWGSLQVCGDIFTSLAMEQAIYETFVEERVVGPLQSLVEVDIPAILKLRERLKRLVLDRDNAAQNVRKFKTQSALHYNPQQASIKLEQLQDELDSASTRMEQCKDQLITEMYEFLSRESQHNQHLLDLHAKRLSYHRKCVQVLENTESKMQATQEDFRKRSTYGYPLEDHLLVTNREIASPIEACIVLLKEYAQREEGIFRVAGSTSKLRKCRAILDAGKMDLVVLNAHDDIHAVAGALKQYLRQLPDPLLTFELHSQWLKAAAITDHDAKLQEILRLIESLPPTHMANLRYVIKFLSLIASQSEMNKMTPSNLAVVMAPNMLWSAKDDISVHMRESNLILNIVESMIIYSDWFFPAEIDFVVTPDAFSYVTNNDATTADVIMPPNQPTKGHSRTSSADGAFVCDAVSGSAAENRAIKLKKQKSKAPPPPDPLQHKARTKLSSSDTEPLARPPVATRRLSSRSKPQTSPPEPPAPSDAPRVIKPPIAARRRQTFIESHPTDPPASLPPPLPTIINEQHPVESNLNNSSNRKPFLPTSSKPDFDDTAEMTRF